MKDNTLKKNYNKVASEYLLSRTKSVGRKGFQNRKMEQPIMFSLVPKNLKNKTLLDVGCGPGVHIKEYSKRGAKCVGIDISNEMIRLAKEYCPQGEFYTGNVNKLDFKNDSFDLVTASLIFDHVKDIDKSLKEINRVLKKNELFIVSLPHPTKYMFRDSGRESFIPTNSYYDKRITSYNIAGLGLRFPGYPRTLEAYFQAFIKAEFSVENFKENNITDSWKKSKSVIFKIPQFCFFVLRKK